MWAHQVTRERFQPDHSSGATTQPFAAKKPTVTLSIQATSSTRTHPRISSRPRSSVIRQTPQQTPIKFRPNAERLPEYFKIELVLEECGSAYRSKRSLNTACRIDYHRQVDAHIRFLSVEPLFGGGRWRDGSQPGFTLGDHGQSREKTAHEAGWWRNEASADESLRNSSSSNNGAAGVPTV